MGTVDEHWCSVCKRDLDKKKDKYVEFELINEPSILKGKKPKKPKGIICQRCIDANPKLKAAIELIAKAGNPNFIISLMCISSPDCENFEPASGQGVNCCHVAVLGDKIYCKRSHPGAVHLPQEKAEVDRFNRILLQDYMRDLLKDPRVQKFIDPTVFEKVLNTAYTPPSSIIEKQHENLPKQAP